VKNIRPIHLVIGGSAIIFFLTLLITFIIDKQVVNFPFWVLFGLPLVTGLISFGVFYYFIQRFINERLKLLYRSIRKGKITKENDFKFNITDDVIANAEKETELWTEERNKEIEKLKVAVIHETRKGKKAELTRALSKANKALRKLT
jgi:two-component system phosphate regulon sensor histidine kinase PhoR